MQTSVCFPISRKREDSKQLFGILLVRIIHAIKGEKLSRMDNKVQIVQQFASAAEHADQCYDFDIQTKLDVYFQYPHSDINFSEAAFLIYDAARIYGRKVDYFEQILLDFNQRSATNVSKALAEVRAMAENADKSLTKTNKKADEQEKRLREKERALKRAKRMLKVTTKMEFKPKQFEVISSDQISLNLHDQRSEFDIQEEFDRVRMKNVFPRINVLQSNLQSNNTFYDNLGIDESDIDNADSLRDFRIFMDTVDEPIFMRPITDKEVDPRYEEELKRSIERANQKHTNIYLPADYIKETYGITLKDNSDYLNMLKYNKEYERLNLRKMTIEQLSKLKIGTYLNNILHGKEQDGNIPEHDSGIDVDDMDRDFDASIPTLSNPNMESRIIDELSTLQNDSDILMTDLSTNQNETLDLTAIFPINDTVSTIENDQLNSSEQSGQITNSFNESLLETSADEVNTSDETNEDVDPAATLQQSLDDTVCTSESNSSSRLSEEFEGFMSTDLVDNADTLNDLNGIVNAAISAPAPKVPTLDSNIFGLPEKLLRRQKIFALTDEFELWMAARKRKFGTKPDPPSCGKLLKLSNGVFIRSDPDSDSEEFLGFDENYALYTAPSLIVDEQPKPPAVADATSQSDSITSPEQVLHENGCDESQTIPNSSDVNDSGVAELNSSVETTQDIGTNSTLDTTVENTIIGENSEKSMQVTDSSISPCDANANSTRLFNECASIVTGFDSGFAELDSTAGLDETDDLQKSITLQIGDSPKNTQKIQMDDDLIGMC